MERAEVFLFDGWGRLGGVLSTTNDCHTYFVYSPSASSSPVSQPSLSWWWPLAPVLVCRRGCQCSAILRSLSLPTWSDGTGSCQFGLPPALKYAKGVAVIGFLTWACCWCVSRRVWGRQPFGETCHLYNTCAHYLSLCITHTHAPGLCVNWISSGRTESTQRT